MKISTHRKDDTFETKRIVIFIGENRYTITESIDNNLNINKISDGDNSLLWTNPRAANEIEIK